MKYVLALTLLFIPLSFATAQTTGLVGHWKFDESSGATATDVSGIAGTLLQGTAWTGGKIGASALMFDGVDDRATFSDSPFNFGTGSFSVSFWVKVTAASSKEQFVLNKANPSLSKGWRISVINSNLRFWARSGETTYASAYSSPISFGEWVHFVAVVDRSAQTMQVYANNVPSKTSSIQGFGDFDVPSLLELSRSTSVYVFNGSVDDLRIYNRTLTGSEVGEIYTEGNLPQVSDTIAPSVPGNFVATGVSGTQASLLWDTSTDNVRVAGYKISRNGAYLTSITQRTYTDITLSPGTSYTYTVTAYDDAGNISSPASVTFETPTSNVELAAGTAQEISQYGITWTFDKAYPYGKYANGDYWVLGPVTIVKIFPDFNGVHNGWDVNPVNSGPQGYDIGAGSFSASVVPALPYVAKPGESIVKAMSIIQDPNITAPCYPECLQTAAVLTVVGAVPSEGGTTLFRPPYVGTSKPSYSTKDIRTDLLPSLAPVGNPPTLDAVARMFQRVQLDHKSGAMGRVIKPKDNLPDYGASVGSQHNEAALRLSLSDPVSVKMPALIYFLQAGIDRYHAVLSGQTYPSGGGHTPGQKISLAFTAVLLNHQGMKDTVKSSKFFSEDIGLRAGINGAIWGFSNDDLGEQRYWEYVKNDPGHNLERPDPYKYIDGGMTEKREINGYQSCCTSMVWKASGLVAMLIPEIGYLFNSPKFFEYIDRWVKYGVLTLPDPCAPVVQGGGPLLDSQGRLQNKCILDPDLDPASPLVKGTGTAFTCQAGKVCGRFPASNGIYANTGLYTTLFQGAMWDAYRKTVTPPAGTGTYTPPPPPTGTKGDFNNDGVVNSVDFSLLAGAWNTSNSTYDLNKDTTVNTLDYSIMAQNWTR